MRTAISRLLPADPVYRRDLAAVYAVVGFINFGAWTWALLAFAGQPVLLGVGAVVYGLGLRHAVDADHIAAIDNITRKFLHQGQRAASIGLWFAVGHSGVILLATALIVIAAGHLSHLTLFREFGALISTSVSGVFLLVVAAMNICILMAIVRTVRRFRAGHAIEHGELDTLFRSNGIFARVFRPLFSFITRPWQMGVLGFVFGLSFDTATEVSLFAISATQASHGVSFGTALVFPALFAAGMSLLDTTDGVMMASAYHWAVEDPLRKLYYNMTITMMSIAVALFVGTVELLTVGVNWLGLNGPVARVISGLSENMNYLGIAIVATFALAWLMSVMTFHRIARGKRLSVGSI